MVLVLVIVMVVVVVVVLVVVMVSIRLAVSIFVGLVYLSLSKACNHLVCCPCLLCKSCVGGGAG